MYPTATSAAPAASAVAPLRTMADVLRERARESVGSTAFTMLGAEAAERISFGELDRRARAIAVFVTELEFQEQPILLALPPGLDYVAALFGCFYAGAIAVPAYPTRAAGADRRLDLILADSGARLVFGHGATAKWATSRAAAAHDPATIDDGLAKRWRESSNDPEQPAVLQYTSGSVGDPNGVVVTHANLLANERMIQSAFAQDKHSVVVSWLPPFHDMGLVGGILQPVYSGGSAVLMSPATFLQSPGRWLAAISRYRATTSGGPNFAFDLCERRVDPESIPALDLSCWRVAFNGAEPVRSATMARFTDRFGPYGFRSEAWHPCYGLAEATLAVTAKRVRRGRPRALRPRGATRSPVASCGGLLDGLVVEIVDPDTLRVCADGGEGEIWVAGPSVAQGYWKRETRSREIFRAALAERPGMPFLRTGDLGFLADGELFVTGRRKDLIVIRGTNHYPDDIEQTVRDSSSLFDGCRGVAFAATEENEERLAIVQEIARLRTPDAGALIRKIRTAVAASHGVHAWTVALARRGTLPRTSSGKIRRTECCARWARGELAILASSVSAEPAPGLDRSLLTRADLAGKAAAARPATLAWDLCARLSAAGIEAAVDDRMNTLGIDSLQATTLVTDLETDLELSLPASLFLDDISVEQAARVILERFENGAARLETAVPEMSGGLISATPFQERLWQITQWTPRNPALAVAQVLQLDGPLNFVALEAALREIVARHPSLRTSLRMEDGKLWQDVASVGRVHLPAVDLLSLSTEQRSAEASRIAREEAQRPFDPASDVPLRAIVVVTGARSHLVPVVMSHLAADGWSCKVFLSELASIYAAAVEKRAHGLPPAIPYAEFSRWQRAFLESAEGASELEYWRHRFRTPALPLHLGRRRGPERSAGSAALRIPEALRRALVSLCRREGVTLHTALLAGWSALLHRLTGETDLTITVPVTNRRMPRSARAIGCYANRLPLRISILSNDALRKALLNTRETVLGALRNAAIPLAAIIEVAASCGRPASERDVFSQLLFDYRTSPERLQAAEIEINPESVPLQAPAFDLAIVLDDNGASIAGSCSYDRRLFTSAEIDALLAGYMRILEELSVDPTTCVGGVELHSKLPSAPVITIAATFTAEPVADSIEYWAGELGWPVQLRFAPYHQIFQQLLDPDSQLSRTPAGANVLLVRLEDWCGLAAGHPGRMALDGERLQRISENVEQFGVALAAAARRAAASLFVFACPASPDTASIEAIERRLEDLTSEAGCYFVSSAELRSTYAVADGFDPQGDCLAHIPYRPEQFTALGTMIVRKIQALGNTRYKVVVLDCDQTLWRGVCGEDGPLGVELDGPAISLQEFMREQREAGMLLCLCSRNNLADVRAAFDRPDMRLRWEDLAAYRVNWRPKPNNLEHLSVELGLPLDSFIFIDDDPLECARARAQCPAVLTLQLPADRDAIAQSLRHIWAFDRLRATADDRARADHYRSQEQRETARARSLDWAEFARELEIEMDIRPAVAADIPRISQLVMRTNQFNASGSRWSEQQLRRMLADGYKGYTARVRDRFGDYGLVGAALFRRAGDALRVDTLAVSCRALGRGVEHRLIQVVGESADRSDVSAVEVVFTPGERNQPALDFLESAAQGQRPEGPRTIYRLSPAALPEITHECL